MSKRIVTVLMVLAVLSGCATTTVSLASSQSDAAAKQFKPPAGKANLYLARSNSSTAPTTPAEIFVDGKDAGQVGPGTFLLVALDPGKHSMSAGSNDKSARMDFELDAGRNYFYTVNVTSSFPNVKANITLVLLEPMGKLMVQQSKRAEGVE